MLSRRLPKFSQVRFRDSVHEWREEVFKRPMPVLKTLVQTIFVYLSILPHDKSMFLAFPTRQQIKAASSLARHIFSPMRAMSTASPTPQGAVYRWQDDVEDLESYRPGGYHPIKLGDEYCQGRYRVVHKLGYGAYSTVWLARDSVAKVYVSLKIITATASERSTESQLLKKIHLDNPFHPGRRFVSSLLNDFFIRGPNGNHRCLVTELVGPPVSDVKESFECDLLPLDIARRVTVQLALGLADIHSCGAIHGDVHLKNIAFRLPNLDSWPTEKIYSYIGPPIKQMVSRNDNNPLEPEAPPYVVPPAILLKLVNPPTSDISILDFGEASFVTESRTRWHTPMLLQAPEALLGEPVGQPSDMWAFACTVFALFDNKSLFEGFMPTTDDVLAEIVDTLGRLPERWWRKWKARGEYYEEDGTKKIEGLTEEYREVKPLAVRIARIRSTPPAASKAEQLSEEDQHGLRLLLEGCLRYEPGMRASAEEVLGMEWIQKLRLSL